MIAIAALVCGCASTPIRYLTLDMEPSGSAATTHRVVIDEIRLNDSLRRPELLVHARTHEIEYYSDALWVSNLAELMTEKFEAEFGSAAQGDSPIRLRIRVMQFEENETGEVRCGRVKLAVSGWMPDASVRADADWSKVYDACIPIEGEDVSDVAAALSAGLEVIALQIAQEIDG